MKVTVVGAGNVGATVANVLAVIDPARELGRVLGTENSAGGSLTLSTTRGADVASGTSLGNNALRGLDRHRELIDEHTRRGRAVVRERTSTDSRNSDRNHEFLHFVFFLFGVGLFDPSPIPSLSFASAITRLLSLQSTTGG